MSTIFPYTVVCGLCGKESTQHRVGSYSTFGGPDLDGRPAHMQRSTMPHWVKECPFCGYVRDRLGEALELDRDTLLRSYHKIETDYDWPLPKPRPQEQERAFEKLIRMIYPSPDASETDICPRRIEEEGDDPPSSMGIVLHGPDLAKRFAKFGAMLMNIGASDEAARQFLRAAWVFDDERDHARATVWRKVAIKEAEFALGTLGPSSPGNLFCVLADMLRRCGEFQRVLDLEPPVQLTEGEERLFRFQKDLAGRGDARAHRVDELP